MPKYGIQIYFIEEWKHKKIVAYHLCTDRNRDILKDGSFSVAALILQPQMSFDLFSYFLSKLISVHIPDHFFHLVPKPLSSRAFHDEGSHVTDQVSS